MATAVLPRSARTSVCKAAGLANAFSYDVVTSILLQRQISTVMSGTTIVPRGATSALGTALHPSSPMPRGSSPSLLAGTIPASCYTKAATVTNGSAAGISTVHGAAASHAFSFVSVTSIHGLMASTRHVAPARLSPAASALFTRYSASTSSPPATSQGIPSADASSQASVAQGGGGGGGEDDKSKSKVSTSSYWGVEPKTFKRADGSDWPWHSFRPVDSYRANTAVDMDKHFPAAGFGDLFAKYLVKSLRFPTDLFFQKRYGCRAMMLETVAAVPGMVAGMLLHLRSLRLIEHSGGWIKALLEEAENERMHLMTFMEVSKPKLYERALIFSVQSVFFSFYTMTYILSPKTAHRIVGYLEEEAVHSYTQFLKELDEGRIENVAAPAIAIDYWRLPADATLRDVVVAVRADEAHHRDVNHYAATIIKEKKKLKDHPAPLDFH